MTQEEEIQRAIEEWAAIAGGPGFNRETEPTLAHYIAIVLGRHDAQVREDALMVLTVYDAQVNAANRGPWRDRLLEWAQ